MKRILPHIVAAFLLCGGAAAEVFTFEDGGAGWTIPPAYSVVKSEGMNGSSAFVFENADPNLPYAYPSCEVALQTGVVYRVSGWIRTENLDPGARKGAQFAIICHDADGKSVAEWYSPGTKGTKDWQKIEFVTRPIPQTAVKGILLSYCTPQALGKAFFDDIQVAPHEDPAVGMVFSSAYRNMAASGNVTFGVALSVPETYSPVETKGVFPTSARTAPAGRCPSRQPRATVPSSPLTQHC